MIRASTILFWLCLTLVVSLGLYHTSYRVDQMNRELRNLNAQIETERRNLHVLKAEWVYLANPSRIEKAAKRYLDLAPTETSQIASLRKLGKLVPTVQESMKTAQVTAHPIATVGTQKALLSPRKQASESGRINTRLVIGQRPPAALPVSSRSYKLAGDDSYGFASLGTEP